MDADRLEVFLMAASFIQFIRVIAVGVVSAMVLFNSHLVAHGQTATRDTLGDLIDRVAPDQKQGNSAKQRDPREDDLTYQQARQLMQAIDGVLKDTAQQRSQIKELPSRDEFIVPPLWTETREDRQAHVRTLMDSALAIVTDAPIVDIQKKVEGLRKNIHELEDQIVGYKERQLSAPKDGMLPGVLTDTVDSLQSAIDNAQKRIAANRVEITKAKLEIGAALRKSGVELDDDQVDLLLDSVLSGDLVRLVAVFHAAKLIDGQLGARMTSAGENMNAARKYFAMHAALFAMLVHAQNATIKKIDTVYLPKLNAIIRDIEAASKKSKTLLRHSKRPDQKTALLANLESQKIARTASRGCRRYLMGQREQIARARSKATYDLKIADNTYETVEASFQLRTLMRDSAASFEALQKLEAPTFEQIFKNEVLRREFENLTRKLDAPTS